MSDDAQRAVFVGLAILTAAKARYLAAMTAENSRALDQAAAGVRGIDERLRGEGADPAALAGGQRELWTAAVTYARLLPLLRPRGQLPPEQVAEWAAAANTLFCDPDAPAANPLTVAMASEYVEAIMPAFGELLSAAEVALRHWTPEAGGRARAAAERLHDVVEDYKCLGSGPWDKPPGGSPALWEQAMAYVRLWRRATSLAPGPEADRVLDEMVAAGLAIGAIAPDSRPGTNNG